MIGRFVTKDEPLALHSVKDTDAELHVECISYLQGN